MGNNYINAEGGTNYKPTECNGTVAPYTGAPNFEKGCWPFAPGPDGPFIPLPGTSWGTGTWGVQGWADKNGYPSWWGNRYSDFTNSHGQTVSAGTKANDWPSFIPSQWKPLQGLAEALSSATPADEQFILYNSTKHPIAMGKGSRIAQLEINPVYDVDFVEVDELSKTDRGEKGIGSTGK